MTSADTKSKRPRARYIDRPEVLEQFADSVRSVPMCRLVLTPDAAMELREKLGHAIRDL